MKTRNLNFAGIAAVALTLGLFSSGCIVVGGGGGSNAREDLTLIYTFGGATCQTAGVSRVVVRVEGVDNSDGTTKDELCSQFPEGMTIANLLVGTYDVTIEGYDNRGLLYEMGAPRRVSVNSNRENRFEIDVESTFGDLTVYWNSFGGISDCASAGVDTVVASLFDAQDNLLDSASIACASAGVTWNMVAPGGYTVQLDAYGSNVMLYQGVAAITVSQGQADTYTVDLLATTGDLLIYWTFQGSGVCGGVDGVRVILRDPSGATYDDATYNCTDTGVQYSGVVQGNWSATLQGLDSQGRILFASGNQLLQVLAGQSNQYVVDLN
ncbi:MAG: hypothetical protein P1V51_20460 [Deltaproteobacteria bacterium]|nr:hypothetical protein [Deltaproteobacteria bacterium]